MSRRKTGDKLEQADPDVTAFAAKVRKHRESLDMTQGEFADLLSRQVPGRKLHQSRVSKWENGEAQPRAWNYIALASATGTPLRYWLDHELTDPADPAAFADAGQAVTDEDEKFLRGIVDRYGARAVIDRFYGAAAPAEPAPRATARPGRG